MRVKVLKNIYVLIHVVVPRMWVSITREQVYMWRERTSYMSWLLLAGDIKV